MDKINETLDNIARPIYGVAEWLLRIGLGISFFLHGYGKMPIGEGFIGWLASKCSRSWSNGAHGCLGRNVSWHRNNSRRLDS